MTEFRLDGLRAENPLAFLAALGTLRAASAVWGTDAVRMCWHIGQDAWKPVLRVDALPDTASPEGHGDVRDAVVAGLQNWLREPAGGKAFSIGDDLTFSTGEFRAICVRAAAEATPSNRRFADFVAAFGCEAVPTRENGKRIDKIADTALRTMSGAGHQHFLGMMRTLAADTTSEHVKRALFTPWRYDDPLEAHSMRWDPADDVRYALRWRDSSGDPERKRTGTMWGANRLAMEGIPLMPSVPTAREQLATVGFAYSKGEGTTWTWPVWDAWCSVDTVRSLLTLKSLQRPELRGEMSRLGVAEVFRCQRIRQGKYRNLTPARPI